MNILTSLLLLLKGRRISTIRLIVFRVIASKVILSRRYILMKYFWFILEASLDSGHRVIIERLVFFILMILSIILI